VIVGRPWRARIAVSTLLRRGAISKASRAGRQLLKEFFDADALRGEFEALVQPRQLPIDGLFRLEAVEASSDRLGARGVRACRG
jgi:hypothetical protein